MRFRSTSRFTNGHKKRNLSYNNNFYNEQKIMNRLKHLNEQRALIQTDLDGIRALCEKENRSRNDAEKTKWAELVKKRDDLDEEIKIEEEENKRSVQKALNTPPAPQTGVQPNGETRVAQEDMSVRGQVASWMTRNADVIKRIKAGERGVSLPAFEFRAANSPMTPSNTVSDTVTMNAGAVIRQGAEIFDLRRTSPTFWDYLPKQKTGLETYPWVNKKVPASSGAAGFIGPGVAKPGVSFTLEVEKSNAKKIAVSLKTATELLDDIDGMTGFIEDELQYQLKIEANSKLMTGTESSTVPAGVQTFSLGFTTSGLSTVNPNNWDCCRAVIAQMRKAFINGPIVIFLNPIDTANMDMEKAVSQGHYLGLNARPIPGGVILEDYNITAGYLQAIAIDCLKTKIYKDFMMSLGWENDDFTKNLVTVIGEMRLHSFHSENDAAAFVYDDFADIKSQIAAA